MSTRVGIVVPTYNEAATIAQALGRLHELDLDDMHVIVVDDGSPDGTAELAEKAAASWPENHGLTILRRAAKSGLGRAYVAGLTAALNAECDIVVQMDADLSHPAQAVPEMVQEINSGADVVIGSRYTAGGQLDADWPLRRRLLSRAANTYVSVLLRLGIADVTAGFVAWRAAALRNTALSTITSNGYAFQVEMKWRASKRGMTITEVPIVFAERAAGTSKMSMKVKVEGLLLPWKLLLSPNSRG